MRLARGYLVSAERPALREHALLFLRFCALRLNQRATLTGDLTVVYPRRPEVVLALVARWTDSRLCH